MIGRYIDALGTVREDQIPADDRLAVLEPSEKEASPLLVHLLDISYFTVPLGDIGPVIASLRVLLAMIGDPPAPDAEGQLVRLVRETLGVAMYRLDAWITSLAAARLAAHRRNRPAGIQVGGFGWLLDLRRSEDRPSQGFVHAPSMNHAVTAAVLRSGWSAYGATGADAPLSIDLTSDRVRGALWILDAVRSGQDLAELLGARFERYLHELRLDEWIESVRLLALGARSIERQPSRTVDGLLVARAAAGVDLTAQEEQFRADLTSATTPVADPAESADRAAVRRAWRRLGHDLDAVSDLAMTQAIHSLIQGNDGAATAAMAMTGGGDGAVPPIDVTSSQRDAQLVHHRVVAVLPGAVPPDQSGPSVVGVAEPRLTRWASAMLPAADRVTATFSRIDSGGVVVGSGTISVAEVGLSALDAALLAGGSPDQVESRLGRVVQGHLVSTNPDPQLRTVLDTAMARTGTVSLDEFGLLGSVLLRFLGHARALAPADLLRPEQSAADLPPYDVDELAVRVADTERSIVALVGALTGSGSRRVLALAQCAALGVSGAVAALDAGATDDAITPVVTALQARLVPATDGQSDSIDSETSIDRLVALVGSRVPILPVFTPVPDSDRAASAASRARRRQIAAEGPHWIAQVGRVRRSIGAYVDAELLGTGIAVGGPPVYELAQVPHTPGPWAAVDRPDDDGDRLSIVSLTGPGGLAADGEPIAGLFVDGWTEAIPRSHAQTAIAVHFDAPSARPPQSILLSVVDAERGFSADEVADQLVHTIELAKMRAVAADALPDIGHYLPAVLVPSGTTISGGS